MIRAIRAAGLLLLAAAGASCGKVPIYDIEAGFVLADASWFAAEQTLFVFYEVRAEQGLSEHSLIEVSYVTDGERVPWTPLSELPFVHTHVPVDCGANAVCGSASLFVPLEPRDVDVRLRYHRDGELALDTEPVYNVVVAGPPHTNRSLVVYGVFDEANERVQWRGRHQFPTLRNERVQDLGLRRNFVVRDQRFGTAVLATPRNPYGYGAICPPEFESVGFPELETAERARFNPEVLPLGAFEASTVCAEVTVTDGTGSFTTGATARKNPEVRPAFPELRSPARDATPLRFFLGPCDRTISREHAEMQRQRLQLGDVPTTCTDDWRDPNFVADLVGRFRDAVEAARPAGRDMVLVIGLHQDEPGVVDAVEAALAQVAPAERFRSSPRLAGAAVLDSTARGLARPDLAPVTLWCPSTLPLDDLPDASSRTCAAAPDDPDVELGPFSFGAVPILPSREQYLDFIDKYSVAQAGRVERLSFRTPEFATIADHIPVGDFGAATFLNNERIGADADDAFSYCAGEGLQLVVFRSELMSDVRFEPPTDTATNTDTEPVGPPDTGGPGPGIGPAPDTGGTGEEILALPIELLPQWHDKFRESNYELGIFWEFPFLVRMEYRIVQAGSVSAFGLSVPFGFASPAESYYGTEVWTRDAFPLADNLLQCTRFCDHPTFDSAGVYHVTDAFRSTYAQACYLPAYPALGDSGFPLDP